MRRHRRTSAWPSVMSARFQRSRSCAASSTRSPSALTRAARRDSISSISATEPYHLGLVRHEPEQRAPEPNRFRREVLANQPLARARRVALIENEIDDREDGLETRRQILRARHAIRNRGITNLAFRARRGAAPS